MCARVCETKRDGQRRRRETLGKTRPRNTAHSAHFPALSYYSLSEPRAEYESARSRAEHLNCIWVKPKQHHHIGNASLLSQIDEA